MSWPPDGQRDGLGSFKTLTPVLNVLVFVVAMEDNHGAIVLVRNRLWWCSLKSLMGEPSGSK